jgi:thimet oligopeptidase
MSAPPLTLGELPFSLTDAELTDRVTRILERARERLAALEADPAPRTVERTLVPLDALLYEVVNLGSHCGFVFVTHPDASVRDAARRGSEATERFLSEFRTRRRIYDALKSLDPSPLDADGRHALAKLLREMRRGGVELSESDRARFLQLSDELEGLSNKFQQNTSELVRTVKVADPAELAGLPADFVAAHPPAPDGSVTLTTRYPDAIPVLSYADHADLRRRMMTEFLLRAYPENMPVLNEVLAKRFEYARLLGYATWADYALEDKMMASRAAAEKFIDRLDTLVRAPAERHVARVLDRKRRDDPSADRVEPWDGGGGGGGYYEAKLREEEFGVDLKVFRDYLPYPAVRDGLLRLCERLFRLTIVPAPSAEVWHPTVDAYDVTRDGRSFGRFYLDLVPREGKYSHAAQFNLRIGIEGVELPQAALVCNFVDPKTPKESARMEYSDVVTFFHEFGHLLHALFSGHGRWLYNTQGFIEWDFVEAPSQLFEEWARDPEVLASFARRPDNGEPIPRELLERLKASEGLARAPGWQFQTALAAAALGFYDRDPATLDPEHAFQSMTDRYLTIPRPRGTHLEAAWGHLMGYSACYYTYAWSLVIARDFLGRFLEKGSLVDPELAARYAETILAPGSRRPATELVESFLGRPFDYRAFETWILSDPLDRRSGGPGGPTASDGP